MAKKTFNNFGATRAAVTPVNTLDSVHNLPWAGNITARVSDQVILGKQSRAVLPVRRTDANFTLRMREYVISRLYTQAECGGCGIGAGGATRWVGAYRYDINNFATKFVVTGSSATAINIGSEAWKNHIGSQPVGFQNNPTYQSLPYTHTPVSSYRVMMPQKIPYSESNVDRNYTPRTGSVRNDMSTYEYLIYLETPSYTPFAMNAYQDTNSNSVARGELEHPFADVLSGMTIGSKKSVTELLDEFREIFIEEALSFCNDPALYDGLKILFNEVRANVATGNKQPYLVLNNLNLPDPSRVMSFLGVNYFQASMGSVRTGGALGLIPLEGNAASAYTGYDTIERMMSSNTINLSYVTPNAINTIIRGNATFTKLGRIGALRSPMIVIPDNLARRKYELGLSVDKPAAPYGGLVSTRPLGQFTSLTTADGWSSEVRLKDSQLSLIAFGNSWSALGANSLGVITNTTSASLADLYSGCSNYNSRVRLSYVKLDSVTTTLDGSSCKVFGWGSVGSVTTVAYNTLALISNLTPVGGVDPTQGTQLLPTGAVNDSAITNTTQQIKLVCIVPYNVDDMKIDGSGNVPYFSLADGSQGTFGTWTCKYAFAYIKGSYNVYNRLVTYGELKTKYGSSKTITECTDLATVDFITECLGYFTVADTDPNPVEQYLAYTPLKYVGYDLPEISSYVKPFYDFSYYPLNMTSGASPIIPTLKKYQSVTGMVSGPRGSRIDSLSRYYYGTKNAAQGKVGGYLNYSSRWKLALETGAGKFLADPMIGYFYDGKAEQIKAKWGGGALFRAQPVSDDPITYLKAGRMGFRVASMNSGILSLSRIFMRYGATGNTPSVMTGGAVSTAMYPITPNTWAVRWKGVQSDVSPELRDALMKIAYTGWTNDQVAEAANLYAVNGQSGTYYIPNKYTTFDYTTDATRVISGVAMRNDIPTAGLHVRLQDRETGDTLAFQLSQAGGKYRFYGCQATREYLVSTIDPQREFTADIEDITRSDK